MSDVSEAAANGAIEAAVTEAPAKRAPSVILADIEGRRSQASTAKANADAAQAVYQAALSDLHALEAEFAAATQEVVGWFTELAEVPDDVFTWLRKNL